MLLHRLTTRYVSLEDRICLTGETDSDETVRLWLTRRLLDGLLPAVFRWLDKLGSDREQHAGTPRAAAGASGEASGPGVAASGGGEAAGGGETAAPKPPIRADRITSEWLVRKIRLTGGDRGVRLTFVPVNGETDSEPGPAHRGDNGTVILVLEPRMVRQWVVILYRQFQSAGWPVQQWPAWLKKTPSPASAQTDQVLH